MTFDTPQAYARHLATYIASPTKIEALVRLEFERSPSLRWIANERYLIEQRRKPMNTYDRSNPAYDGIVYSVPGLVKPPAPKPSARSPAPRKRDYINVAAKPKSNPFLGPFKVGPAIVSSVAKDFGLDPSDITGLSRTRDIVDARATVAAVLKRWGRLSYPAIGRVLGGRDHSTVIHAVSMLDIYIRRNPTVADSYARHARMVEEAEREQAMRQQYNELVAA